MALIGSCALVNVLRRPALRLARRLTGGYANLGGTRPAQSVEEWSRRLSEEVFDEQAGDRRKRHTDGLVEYALRDAGVRALLDRLDLGERDVRAFLMLAGVPLGMIDKEFQRQAMTNVNLLTFYFGHSTPLENEYGYQRQLDGMGSSILLTNWIRYAPDQPGPPR